MDCPWRVIGVAFCSHLCLKSDDSSLYAMHYYRGRIADGSRMPDCGSLGSLVGDCREVPCLDLIKSLLGRGLFVYPMRSHYIGHLLARLRTASRFLPS
jgi:hypothetical protein